MRWKSVAALALAIGLMVVVSLVRTADRGTIRAVAEPPPGLAGLITAFLASQHAEQPYRDPTDHSVYDLDFDGRPVPVA